MTAASHRLGRRIRTRYILITIMALCGFIIGGMRVDHVFVTMSTLQRGIEAAAGQGSRAVIALASANTVVRTHSPNAAAQFDQLLSGWAAEQRSISADVRALCVSSQNLCDRFEDLRAEQLRISNRLSACAASDTYPCTLHDDRFGVSIEHYARLSDEWSKALSARVADFTSGLQRALYLGSVVFALFAVIGVALLSEHAIRRAQRGRDRADRWTAEKQALAAFAETTHHPIIRFDPAGRVEWANEAFLGSREELLSSVVGLSIKDLLRPPEVLKETLESAFLQMLKGEGFQVEVYHRAGPLALSWGFIECRPVFKDGQLIAYFAIESDITARKKAEDLVRQERALLEATTSLASVGGYRIEIATDHITWTDSMFAIHEIEPGPIPSFDDILQRFPVAARPKVIDGHRALLQDGVSSNFEVEFVTAKGNHRWVRSVVTPQYMDGVRVAIVGAVLDVTEAHAQAEALKNAKEAADAANLAKGQFLANMSHEIRTPMNGVIGMTDLLLDTPLTSAQREYAEIVRSSGQALLGVINDILDLSKIESGHLELENIDFDLQKLIDDTTDTVALKAAQKGVELLIDIDPLVPTCLRGDPTRIRQVLLNLMSNAVKFTAVGEITVTVTHDTQPAGGIHLKFAVADSGIGIDREAIEGLFTPFKQADSSTTRRYGGTGLGLSICRKLVAAMGGTIDVQSTLGTGSVFRFSITVENGHASPAIKERHLGDSNRILMVIEHPQTRRLLQALTERWGADVRIALSEADGLDAWTRLTNSGWSPHVIIVDNRLGGAGYLELGRMLRALDRAKKSKLLLLTSLAAPPTDEERKVFELITIKPIKSESFFDVLSVGTQNAHGVTKPVGDMPFSGRHALLVDDNIVNRKVADHLLRRLGMTVDQACSGEEALRLLQKLPYDVVLMDCQMPEMDGFEATRQLRQAGAGALNSGVPVIALTASALSGDRERCLLAGMTEYLTKPINSKRLHEILGATMSAYV